MSDQDKVRPLQERIARLAGSSAFKDVREGFAAASTSMPITDSHIATALALCRRPTSHADCDVSDIGPEVLETYYGSSQQHRRRLVSAYLRQHAVDDEPMTRVIVRRMAATLAVQRVAGLDHTRAQQAEYAFIVATRLETLRDQVSAAYQWYMERHDRALPHFLTVLRAIMEQRLVEFLAARAKLRSDRDATRLKAAKMLGAY